MIDMVRPRAFVPVHGTLRHLKRHGVLAAESGVPEVCVLENGDLAEMDAQGIRTIGRVQSGRVAVHAGRAVPESVLAERGLLAESGALHVSVPVDAAGKIAGRLEVSTRGVVDEVADHHLLKRAREAAAAAVLELSTPDDDDIADAVRGAVRRAFGKTLGFRPVTWVTVHRVAS
jgi:ribonuclease J